MDINIWDYIQNPDREFYLSLLSDEQLLHLSDIYFSMKNFLNQILSNSNSFYNNETYMRILYLGEEVFNTLINKYPNPDMVNINNFTLSDYAFPNITYNYELPLSNELLYRDL